MKKISLYLSLMIFSGSLIGQINNGDFENWTMNKLYDFPTKWNSSNQEFRGITQNAIKSSDAQHLASSIKLETTLVNGDTTFAFVLHGEPNDTGIGGGIPFTGTIDSLIFWVKYSIVAGDSATAIIITKNSGFATGTDVMKWTGLQSVWTRKALKVSSTLPVDSIIVGFVSGNAFEDYSYPGSWVLLDNVSVKLTSGTVVNLPNHSFENWDSISYEEPNDWYSFNSILNGDTIAFKSSNSHSGSYSVRMKNILGPDGDTVTGILSNAPFDVNGGDFGKKQSSLRPDKLSFFYTYNPSSGDTSFVGIEFFNGTTQIGTGYGGMMGTTSSFTLKDIPITYTSTATPDSMRILFYTGDNANSELQVDLVSVSGGNVSVDEIILKNSLKCFPNPVNNELKISFDLNSISNETKVVIYDLRGKLILAKTINSSLGENILKINTSYLPSGVYNISVLNNDYSVTKKFIKN